MQGYTIPGMEFRFAFWNQSGQAFLHMHILRKSLNVYYYSLKSPWGLPASCFSCTGNPPREAHVLSPLPRPLPALGSWSLHSARPGMVQTKMNRGGWVGEHRGLDCTCQGWAWKTRATGEGWPGGTGPSRVGTWSYQGAKKTDPAWLLPRTTPLPSMGLLGLQTDPNN